MSDNPPTFWSLTLKSIVTHTITYFIMGILAFLLLDYSLRFADPQISVLMRQTDDPWVMAGPLFQPLRGFLFAIPFYLLRDVLFSRNHGWLVMWLLLLIVGVFSTFGPSPGSIEGLIYTTLPLWFQLGGLPEVILQSLFFSGLLYYWVNHPQQKWLSWLLGIIFLLMLLLPTLGLLLGTP